MFVIGDGEDVGDRYPRAGCHAGLHSRFQLGTQDGVATHTVMLSSMLFAHNL